MVSKAADQPGCCKWQFPEANTKEMNLGNGLVEGGLYISQPIMYSIGPKGGLSRPWTAVSLISFFAALADLLPCCGDNALKIRPGSLPEGFFNHESCLLVTIPEAEDVGEVVLPLHAVGIAREKQPEGLLRLLEAPLCRESVA